MKYAPAIDRFMAKVEMIPEAGCWLWTACVHSTGYGRFGMGGNEVEYSHRAAWRLLVGEIPESMYVCHKCDIRICVNPYHLFIGTASDNMQDASRKGRILIPKESHASDETHQPAKLTNDQVISIRESSSGLSALSGMYGVSKSAIWAARTGRTFRDVL
jgi:hypothetical protein